MPDLYIDKAPAVRATPQDVSDPDAILTDPLPKESDHAIITRLDGFFRTAHQHPVWRDWRVHASKAYRFREGDHYTTAELAELADRGQPPSIRNEIKPYVERIHGQLLQTRLTATYTGRNTPVDDQAGQVLRDLGRHVDQRNEYEFQESDIILDGLVGGFGVLEMDCTYNDLGQKEVLEQWEDPFVIFPDPFFRRYDLTDCKYINRAKWLDLDDAIAKWPDKEMELRQLVNGHAFSIHSAEADFGIDPKVTNDGMGLYLDSARKRIRPVECWYRRKVRRYWIVNDQGVTVLNVPLDLAAKTEIEKRLKGRAVFREEIADRMYVGVFCAGLLIHHDLSPRRHNKFPFLFLMADRKKNGEPFGPVSQAVPIQEAINKRESKALNMLSNRRILAEENAIKDPEEAQRENAKADGYVETAQGALSGGRVQFPDNVDIGQAQVLLMQQAVNAMPRVLGISDESMGYRSEVRSGSGIRRKQAMTNVILNPLVSNLRRFRKEKAKLQLALIKETYTEEMTFQVTDDPNAARYVALTKDHISAIKEQVYDVVIAESPDYLTVREEQLDMLFTLMPQIAQYPGLMRLAIAMSDLRDKEALLKMLDDSSKPAPVKPTISLSMKWEELSDIEKAFMAMLSMQSPELAEFLAQRSGDPAFLEKIKAHLAATKIREGTRATVERGKLDLAAMQTAMEGLMDSRRQSGDRDAAAQEAAAQAAAAQAPAAPPEAANG